MHQFHDEVGPAGVGGAAVEDFGDVRMVHHGQRLPLDFEAGDDALGVHAELDDLQRDAAADGLLLFGHVDDTASAFADSLQQLVTSDAIAGFFAFGAGKIARMRREDFGLQDGGFQEGAQALFFAEQGFDARAELGIVRASGGEVGGALGVVGLLQGSEKEFALG